MDPAHRVDLAASISGPAPWPRRGPELRPSSTGAASATAKALPAMEGRFDGVAVRGPVVVGALADVVFVLDRDTTPEEVNDVLRQEATSERYQACSAWPRATGLGRHHQGPRASIVQLDLTPGGRRQPRQGDELVRQRVGVHHQMVQIAVQQLGVEAPTPAGTGA